MKHLLLGAALLAASSASAQLNRVSLNIQPFSASSNFSEYPSSAGRSETRSASILPAIGYHRMLKGNTGVGLEIGYNRSRQILENRYSLPGMPGVSRYETAKYSYDEFYVCPGIFEVLTTSNKRYRLIPSLGLPVSYTPNSQHHNSSTMVQDIGNETLAATVSETAPQRTLRIGLAAGAAAQIRVAGGFYAGIHLGAGINYVRQKTTGETVLQVEQQGSPSSRTVTPVNPNLTQYYNFSFLPQISMNYFF